jgi:hypothetical protein
LFLRTFVDFDGLSADEILARLFAWWFGPGFLALFVRFLVPTIGSYVETSSVAAYAGVVLTGLVVFRDARRATVATPWLWAVATAVIPLIGWWAYGRVRAPDVSVAVAAYRGRPSALARYANPFWHVRSELLTRLTPEVCATRLNAVRWNWLSPRQWFTSQQERPVQGSVSLRGFSLRWRHAMTRPGLLTEASARFEKRDGATLIHLRLGQSVGDRVFVLLWLAVAVVIGLPNAVTNPPGAPAGFHQLWLAGWLGIFLLVHVLIRTISRDDDLRLRRLIMQTLEAEEIAPAS